MNTSIRSIIIHLLTGKQPDIVIAPPESLQGITVLITGASSGVGKSTALLLHKLGANIIAVSRDKKKLDSALPKEKGILTLSADITNEEAVTRLIQDSLKTFPKIDVVINNAGVFLEKKIESISLKEFADIIDTNIQGMFLLSRAIVPVMKKQKGGLIINIGSKISHNSAVTKNKVLYATTKYAVEGFSLALRNELFDSRIRVTCLMSATIHTFDSLQSNTYLAKEEIGSVIGHIIAHPHISYEHLIIQSVDQKL